MNTTTQSVGNFCTGCVAIAVVAIAIATLATVTWALFL